MKHLKVTSVLLSAVMCMSMLMTPATVLADETEVPSETQTTEAAEENEPEEADEQEPEVVEDKEVEGEDKAEAEDAYLGKGKCGKKVKWTLDKKGTLKITGKGAMKNYALDSKGLPATPWYKYASKIKKIVVSKKVTSVGHFAFFGCQYATSVSLPKTLKSIGTGSFAFCLGLKSISIPKKCKTIGIGAFSACLNLSSIKLPKGLTTICEGAFNCSGLVNVVLPNTVKTIGNYSFGACSNLTSITIPASVRTIGESAFESCTSLKTVNIPIAGVTSIGEEAFKDCTSLTSIKVPLSVDTLGRFAFDGCTSLEEAWISAKLYAKSTGTFNGCTKLDPDNTHPYDYADTNESFMTDDFGFVVTWPDINGNGTVSVVAYNPNLEKVVIPSVVEYRNVKYKVTRIEKNSVVGAGDNTHMKTLVIGSNVTSIADSAFKSCIALVSVTGGAKLKTIGLEAFANCPNLKVFNIASKTLSKIGPYCFNGDTALTTLQLKKTTKLTKSGVKHSLGRSSVKTVKVKKSKVKKYKKIFKKKNCGRKVKVKK